MGDDHIDQFLYGSECIIKSNLATSKNRRHIVLKLIDFGVDLSESGHCATLHWQQGNQLVYVKR